MEQRLGRGALFPEQKTFVIDFEKAIANALAEVFPMAR